VGKRIVFAMKYDGLIRMFEPTVRVLADRGHRITIVNEKFRPQPSIVEYRRRLESECPGLEFRIEPAPEQTRWRAFVLITRALTNYLRFYQHRFDDADVLRRRAEHDSALPNWARRATFPVRMLGDRAVRGAISTLRMLERVASADREVRRLLEELRPDVVLVSRLVDFESEQQEYIKAADGLGIPSAVCVASWDNLTIKGDMHVVPDRVIVWNEGQKREAVELHGVDPGAVVITGAQNFDHWFDRRPSRDRETFCRTVGLDPDRPFVVFVGSSFWISPADVLFVERWIRQIRNASDPAVAGMGILVRPHPGSFLRFGTLDTSLLGNISVWPWGTYGDTYAEYAESQRDDLFDSLYHCAAIVGANTSVMIEAGILGRPVLTLAVPEFANAQGSLHFAHLQGGLIRIARDFDEHLEDLSAIVSGDGVDDEEIRGFIREFVRPNGLDRPAAPILADAIEQAAELQVAPRPQTAGVRVARVFLTPFVWLVPSIVRLRGEARPLWLTLARPLFWLWLQAVVLRARLACIGADHRGKRRKRWVWLRRRRKQLRWAMAKARGRGRAGAPVPPVD
jgi:hypothetical protein